MASKRPQQLRDKGNTEDGASVIANWVDDEQPRERLSRYGASDMSTAELLAICLVSGVPGEDAVQLARRLLGEFGGIGGLLAAPLDRLRAAHGLGLAKAAQIKAIRELGVRDTESSLVKSQLFQDPSAVSEYLQTHGHIATRGLRLPISQRKKRAAWL